jgi:hypothetical protein
MADEREGLPAGSNLKRKNIEEEKNGIEDQIVSRLCYHYQYSKLVLWSLLKLNSSLGSSWPLNGKPCFVELSRKTMKCV